MAVTADLHGISHIIFNCYTPSGSRDREALFTELGPIIDTAPGFLLRSGGYNLTLDPMMDCAYLTLLQAHDPKLYGRCSPIACWLMPWTTKGFVLGTERKWASFINDITSIITL